MFGTWRLLEADPKGQLVTERELTFRYIDWLKNYVTGEVQSLLYNLIPGSW